MKSKYSLQEGTVPLGLQAIQAAMECGTCQDREDYLECPALEDHLDRLERQALPRKDRTACQDLQEILVVLECRDQWANRGR